jgi:UDP-2,3-diacylglucosamine hydrolase
VAHYFASDVHLRLDCPERDRRFGQWIARLGADDELTIGGDLCDFWMAARPTGQNLSGCASLRALANYRQSGGTLRIMPGNHDLWLCPLFERELGAEIITEPYDVTIHGLRIRLVHGHLLGARRRWKSWMESRAFFDAFGHFPSPVARALDFALAWRNERGLLADEERHLRSYRRYADGYAGTVDIVVVGHVHRAVDLAETSPRLIVLGGWQRRTSYLRVDESGATFHVEHDDTTGQCATAAAAALTTAIDREIKRNEG